MSPSGRAAEEEYTVQVKYRGLRGLVLGCAFGAARSRGLRRTFQRQGRGDGSTSTSSTTSTRATDVEFEYKIDLEGLVSLCKRRGFVFPSGEVPQMICFRSASESA
eukprot:s2135_g23.t1